MKLSLIDKILVVFKYLFSSFLSVEIFLLSILLLVILLFNQKKKNLYIQLATIGVYVGFVLGIFISYTDYVRNCIDSFFKAVLNYIYFPSPIMYFFIIVFVTVLILYTLFSKKLTNFKKVVNYSTFSIMFFFFMSFMSTVSYNNLDFTDFTLIYENDTLLALIQVSNFTLLLWFIYTGFYHLFLYFKKRFDK